MGPDRQDIADSHWPLSTDYDGRVTCEPCDDRGVLLHAPECWSFTVTQLLALIAEHRKVCPAQADRRYIE